MQLYIAEKPSLARAIAQGAGGGKNAKTHIVLTNGDVVTWCVGHLLEQAPPENYHPEDKKWRLERLPIIPNRWQLVVKKGMSAQINAIKKLAKQANRVIHAGDPDREGQLLVDEVLHYIGLPKTKLTQCQRLLVSDLTPQGVRKALASLAPNSDYRPLSTSALARSRADWLFGINLTRAMTVLAGAHGFKGVLSIGRVQTPILGLIVRQDERIAAFVPHPFYQVTAHCEHRGNAFALSWRPSDKSASFQDSEGRIIHRPLAQAVADKITAQMGRVTKLEGKKRKQNAPALFDLAHLQIEANKMAGLSAQATLSAAQSLYERHQLISYPRSDCRYLPTSHYAAHQAVLQTAVQNLQERLVAPNLVKSGRPSCFNDAKVGAHHAIVPTEKRTDLAKLSSNEQVIYFLVARQYVAQFCAGFEYLETQLEATIDKGVFQAKARQVLALGWKALYKAPKEEVLLPSSLSLGSEFLCERGEVVEKMTSAPKPFTDATLLAALTGIAKYVEDAEAKKVLKETDGLGTEATRASMIELLLTRGYVVRQGKQLCSTELGRRLINALPHILTTPDLTAIWEQQLAHIAKGEMPYQAFMDHLLSSFVPIITQAKEGGFTQLAALPAPPVSPTKGRSGRWKRKSTKTKRSTK